MKQIIAAYDKNRGIGADNDLLWHRDLPADLQRFKELTVGTSLVMGRKTFESIGRALPHRQNIVVTHQEWTAPGVTVAHSLHEAYRLATNDTISVIGGGEIYQQALTDIDTLHITEVDAEFPNATVFFPVIDTRKWHEVARVHYKADNQNRYSVDFVTYLPNLET